MTSPESKNIQWQDGEVDPSDRERLLGQRGCVFWLTGLSGSGKSAIAYEAEMQLISRGHLSFVLDGDNIRHGLSGDLGFSPEDRAENARRVAEAGKLIAETGTIVLIALISPERKERERARKIIGSRRFFEVWIATPLEVCEKRDPKGLYAKARAGEIENFTGISAPYEEPEFPALVLAEEGESLDESVERLLGFIESSGILKTSGE